MRPTRKMEPVVDSQITALESLLLNVPGCSTPLGRALVLGGAGAGVAYGLRPSISFFPDGRVRPFIVTHPQDPEATMFPWWAYAVVPAVLFGVFI